MYSHDEIHGDQYFELDGCDRAAVELIRGCSSIEELDTEELECRESGQDTIFMIAAFIRARRHIQQVA